MTFKEAIKSLKKTGTAHAKGDALAAMYAQTIAFHCAMDYNWKSGKNVQAMYETLRAMPDEKMIAAAHAEMRNPISAWDLLPPIEEPTNENP
jgi:hypothetical protein